jgi:hypothetical protein
MAALRHILTRCSSIPVCRRIFPCGTFVRVRRYPPLLEMLLSVRCDQDDPALLGQELS